MAEESNEVTSRIASPEPPHMVVAIAPIILHYDFPCGVAALRGNAPTAIVLCQLPSRQNTGRD